MQEKGNVLKTDTFLYDFDIFTTCQDAILSLSLSFPFRGSLIEGFLR